jgi:Pyruvate/2-oxoacid:ferredoxin oxidoreductase delta subunit
MPELMTKHDAIEYLLYMKHDVQAKSPMDIALDTAIEALKQPTIEAEPVRHGRWIDVPDANTKVAKCSLCGFWQRTNGDDKTGKHLIHTAVYRYCAGCGARMDATDTKL